MFLLCVRSHQWAVADTVLVIGFCKKEPADEVEPPKPIPTPSEAKTESPHVDIKKSIQAVAHHTKAYGKTFVVGSVALQRYVGAEKEKWSHRDVDFMCTDSSPTSFTKSTQSACGALGGLHQRRLTPVSWAKWHQGIMDISKCTFPNDSKRTPLSFVHVNHPIETMLQGAKPPAIVAFSAHDPTQWWGPTSPWTQYDLRNRWMSCYSKSHVKYLGRGFKCNPHMTEFGPIVPK